MVLRLVENINVVDYIELVDLSILEFRPIWLLLERAPSYVAAVNPRGCRPRGFDRIPSWRRADAGQAAATASALRACSNAALVYALIVSSSSVLRRLSPR